MSSACYKRLFLILVLNLINPALLLEAIGGTYNATEAVDIKGTYNDTKIINIGGTYNDTDIIDIGGTYNKTDIIDIGGTYNDTDIIHIKGTYNTTNTNNVDGTYNNTGIIRMFPPITLIEKDDTPMSQSPLRPKLPVQILPSLRRKFENLSTQNIRNQDSVKPTEKYVQFAINKFSDVVKVDDVQKNIPVPIENLSARKIGSQSEDLTNVRHLLVAPIVRNQTTSNWRLANDNDRYSFRDWPLPITYSTTQKPNWLIPNPNIVNVPKAITQPDRIMILPPRKEVDSTWDADAVKSKLQKIWLKKWTEIYLFSLRRKNEHMPIIDADNKLWSKYSRAVVENFLLTFYRTYLKETSLLQWSTAEYYEVRAYNNSFDAALRYLTERKGQTALQFAAQPRMYLDIQTAIIDKPVNIVQSHCRPSMPSWMCNAKYLAQLTDESENCSAIWRHALIHLNTIEANARMDPSDIIVDELESKIHAQPSNEMDLLFDFIVDTIESLRIQIKESLIANTKLYRDIKDFLEKDLLSCLTID